MHLGYGLFHSLCRDSEGQICNCAVKSMSMLLLLGLGLTFHLDWKLGFRLCAQRDVVSRTFEK